jgi:hypothetical protein
MTPATPSDRGAPVDHFEAIRKHVAAVIEADEEFEVHLVHKAREREAEGYRIVAGGQTGPHVDGLASWELTDWRTGDPVASGRGLDSFQAVFEEHRWWHIDSVTYDLPSPVPDSVGLPPGLGTALAQWASSDPIGAEMWLEATAPSG